MSQDTCLPSHPAMSSSCQLYDLFHTWTLCKWLLLIRPRVHLYSSHVVTNNFQPWRGALVVDVGVLSCWHVYDKRLFTYWLATINQSHARPTLPCSHCSVSRLSRYLMSCVHVSALYDSNYLSHFSVQRQKWLEFHNEVHLPLLPGARCLLTTHGLCNLHNDTTLCLQERLHGKKRVQKTSY